ncbi:MAG: hypothetical protein IPJ69_06060 [Deltaproteobacteria bacterium]|nr:MAG: hypothetical protein IPJ69_06060 [Deltaproteobacteria bacterium]
MKKVMMFLALTILINTQAHAESVPHVINFQSVLRDDNGNLIPDGPIDLNFKILDNEGHQVYLESQPSVQVIRGAINVMIGDGIVSGTQSTGIPIQALDPTAGERFLQYQIGSNQPVDPISFGSLPYAVWSEKALSVSEDTIGSEEVKNGSLKAEDLEAGTLQFSDLNGLIANNQLPADILHLRDLTAHKSESHAHLAGAIDLAPGTSLASGPATTVQEAVHVIDDRLRSEVVDRTGADNAHAIQDISTAHPNGDFPTTRLQGQITNEQIADGAITASKLANGVVSASALADNSIGSSKITDESITSADIQNGTIQVEDIFRDEADSRSLDNRYVNESGDTLSGPLSVADDSTTPYLSGGNFNVGRTLRNHETRLGDLEHAAPIHPCGNYYAYGVVQPFVLGIPLTSNQLDTQYPYCNVENVTVSGYGIDSGFYEWTIDIGPTRPTGQYLTFVTSTFNACSVSAAPWYPTRADARHRIHVLMHCPSGNGGFQFMVIQP